MNSAEDIDRFSFGSSVVHVTVEKNYYNLRPHITRCLSYYPLRYGDRPVE